MLQTLSTLEDVQKMYDWFEQMRNTQPVWLDESSGCWHVFRYADVLMPSVAIPFSRQSAEDNASRHEQANAEDGQPRGGRSIIAMDPPQHRQYRNLVSPSRRVPSIG